MTADLRSFTNGEFHLSVRVTGGTFTVLAPGVAKALGFRDAHRLLESIPRAEKGYTLACTPGGRQRVGYLTEPGFFRALGQRQVARIPDAAAREAVERFQTWVYGVVLPGIRRHGVYATPATVDAMLADPDTMIRVLTELRTERRARQALEAKAEADAPKVIFADAVAASPTGILVGELAKILKGNGVEIGQNRLFERLRNEGYLMKRNGTDRNMPTQKSMRLGLFEIKETAVTHADGYVTAQKTPKVTGKGQAYFVHRYLKTALTPVAEPIRPAA